MSRLYYLGHTHLTCSLSLAQEMLPVQATENKEGKNDQHNIIVAPECATATIAVAETATPTGAANTPTTETTTATVVLGETSPMELDAFSVAPNGFVRSKVAVRVASGRAIVTIVDAIRSVGTLEQQSLALHKALLHPSIHHVAEVAGFNTDQRVWNYQRKNVMKVLELTKKGGRSDNVKSAFIKSVMVALTSAPEVIKNNQPSLRKQAKSLGLGVSRGWRYLSDGSKKRKNIETGEEYYPGTKKAKRLSRYDAAYIESL
jgi:hypothetical protein